MLPSLCRRLSNNSFTGTLPAYWGTTEGSFPALSMLYVLCLCFVLSGGCRRLRCYRVSLCNAQPGAMLLPCLLPACYAFPSAPLRCALRCYGQRSMAAPAPGCCSELSQNQLTGTLPGEWGTVKSALPKLSVL